MRALSLALHAKGEEMSRADFEKVLSGFNIFPSVVDAQTLMKSFGASGMLNVESFMMALRAPLAGRRAAIVDAAWNKIDPSGSGCISVEKLSDCYDVTRNADFVEGTMTKEQIFQSFVDGLSYNGQPVKEVRCSHEWKFYQEDMSLAIVDDVYFVRMTEAVWGV